MEACAGAHPSLGKGSAYLCNKQATQFYLLMMPGEKPFKTKLLSKQIGSSRLSFASAEHMERLLDITPGSLYMLRLRGHQLTYYSLFRWTV